MHLAFDDHGIDHVAEIVRRHEGYDLCEPGRRVDLHLANIGPGWVGEVLRIVERGLFQARLQRFDRIFVRHVGGQGDLAEGLLTCPCPSPYKRRSR